MKKNTTDSKVVIFSQAPADIRHVLYLYEGLRSGASILIVVVNARSNYEYLRSLNLAAAIDFVPLVSPKNVLAFLALRVRLESFWRKNFLDLERAQVYFFARNFDYVTPFFVERLSSQNQIYYTELYHTDGLDATGVRCLLSKAFFRIFLGIKIRFFLGSGHPVYQYLMPTNVLFRSSDIELQLVSSYYHRPKIKKDRSLLLFESNGELQEWYESYQEDLEKIINDLISEFDIFIKPHPRLGCSAFLYSMDVEVIDGSVPAEMLSLDCFECIMGIETTSLVTADHPRKISIINLFRVRDESVRGYYKRYLDHLGAGKFSYVNDIDSLIYRSPDSVAPA